MGFVSVRSSLWYVRNVCECAKSRDMYFENHDAEKLTIRGGYNDEDYGNRIDVREKHMKRGTEDGLNARY